MRRRNQVVGWPAWAGWLLAAVLLAGFAGVAPSALRAQEKGKSESGETEKQEKKKKESKSSGRERGRTPDTRKVLSRVLRSFKDGFEALSPSTLRDWVDRDKFYDYPRFEEGVTVLLRSVSEMRVFTREVNVQVEGDRAVMIVEAEMALASRQDSSQRETRRQRITFDFQRTSEGWLITEINPRSFFLP